MAGAGLMAAILWKPLGVRRGSAPTAKSACIGTCLYDPLLFAS
jgi:hypothetical protein